MPNCTLSLFVYSIVYHHPRIILLYSSCLLYTVCTLHDLGINNGVSGYQEHSFIHRLEATAHPCTVIGIYHITFERYRIDHALETPAAYIWDKRPERLKGDMTSTSPEAGSSKLRSPKEEYTPDVAEHTSTDPLTDQADIEQPEGFDIKTLRGLPPPPDVRHTSQ